MPAASLLVVHAAELVTLAGPSGPRAGALQGNVQVIDDGAVAEGREAAARHARPACLRVARPGSAAQRNAPRGRNPRSPAANWLDGALRGGQQGF